MQSHLPCHLCGGPLEVVSGYSIGGQVTSDCRPWRGHSLLAACQSCGTVQKPNTTEWLVEVSQIYRDYAVYSQADGGEQLSFDPGSGNNQARSYTIVNWLKSHKSIPESGRLLDIGCGNGSFLRAFGESFPGWHMVGAELDDRNRILVESIPGVSTLHAGPLEDLQGTYDLIAMIHALEHIPDSGSFLRSLWHLLSPGGSLLIEVPDLQKSPFDILIADHCTHFSAQTLQHLLVSSDYSPLKIDNNCVDKELTVLAHRGGMNRSYACDSNRKSKDVETVVKHLRWLEQLLSQANTVNGDLGIFGTSISATWLASFLGDRVKFFVDEDTNRVGKQHLGLPILKLENAPFELPILMPMRYDIAAAISSRIGSIHPALIPPPLNQA